MNKMPLTVQEWDDLVAIDCLALPVEIAARIRAALVERDSWEVMTREYERASEEITQSGVFRING
jgi:hypothetical protein